METGHRSVVAYRRVSGGRQVTVAVNLSPDRAQTVLVADGAEWSATTDPPGTITLGPYGAWVWERSLDPQRPGEVG